MSNNIFDQSSYRDEIIQEHVERDRRQRSGFAGFLVATATLSFLALVVPIYVHILVDIAKWSWNLI